MYTFFLSPTEIIPNFTEMLFNFYEILLNFTDVYQTSADAVRNVHKLFALHFPLSCTVLLRGSMKS